MKLLDKITPLEENFAKWYQDVVTKGELIAYGNAKGSMIFKPNSFGIWENIQKQMDIEIKKAGASNVYLPLLIPLSHIEKEKDHIEGFAPELATVTKVGNKDLAEPLVIRPTSEVLFCELFQKTVHSYNDLPIIYNQWANVVRWEKTTNPFLRNREFLWQEGHTVHETAKEAEDLAKKMINIYAQFAKEFLAIPVIMGEKTPREKFAGAHTTYTIEAMMKDGKALQAGTSHYLAQNFSKPFNIQFKNRENKKEFAFGTSWGVSTRLIGGLIMTHGDNRGVIVPPKVALHQIDILELFGQKNPNVRKEALKIYEELKKYFRVRLDDSDKGPGRKAGQSEIEGTPLRIEVGPRDLEKNMVTLVRRDNLEKIQVEISKIKEKSEDILNRIQKDLYENAKNRLNNNTVEAKTYTEMIKLIKEGKFVIVPFDGKEEDEKKIKEETLATARCIPFNGKKESQKCIITNKMTNRFVIFARAY